MYCLGQRSRYPLARSLWGLQGLYGQSPCPCWDTNHVSSVAHFVTYSLLTMLPQFVESCRSTKSVNIILVGWGEGVENVEHLQHNLDLSRCCILAVCCMERFYANKNLICCMERFYANKNLIKLEIFWHVSCCCMNDHWKTSRIRIKTKTIKLFRN